MVAGSLVCEGPWRWRCSGRVWLAGRRAAVLAAACATVPASWWPGVAPGEDSISNAKVASENGVVYVPDQGFSEVARSPEVCREACICCQCQDELACSVSETTVCLDDEGYEDCVFCFGAALIAAPLFLLFDRSALRGP